MNAVQKICKFLLAFLSWAPLVWTVILLVSAYEDRYGGSPALRQLKYGIEHGLVAWAAFYVPIGFLIWLLLLILLSWKKLVNSKQRNLLIILVVAGIMGAVLTLYFDVFCVNGCYLD